MTAWSFVWLVVAWLTAFFIGVVLAAFIPLLSDRITVKPVLRGHPRSAKNGCLKQMTL